ncbi:MAG: hypothetical protein NZM04_08165 [Methylacidiphilales bacterium]|nr:hypothetical protein [Candidatus Methylacidiphilales bacterium]
MAYPTYFMMQTVIDALPPHIKYPYEQYNSVDTEKKRRYNLFQEIKAYTYMALTGPIIGVIFVAVRALLVQMGRSQRKSNEF